MAAERFDEAVSYFEQGIALGDGEQVQQMMYNMGAVYEKRGDFGKALETFRNYVSKYGSTPESEASCPLLPAGRQDSECPKTGLPYGDC